ncbi:hypothetical protein BGZ60DRAFT_512251 [Tricladium varicosporioides]|nr:hypothetical protein BGZ60DRAFT_512251 [Hymenoscyphus varicosporioides]
MFSSGGSCALCLIFIFIILPVRGDVQTIWNGTAFLNLAGCAQGCIFTQSLKAPTLTNCDVLGLRMGCPVYYCSDSQNSCYCQPSRQATATNYLSGCSSLQTSPPSPSAATTIVSTPSPKGQVPIPTIVGSTVGGIIFLAFLAIAGCLLHKKRKRSRERPQSPAADINDLHTEDWKNTVNKFANKEVTVGEQPTSQVSLSEQTAVNSQGEREEENVVSSMPNFTRRQASNAARESVSSWASNPTHAGPGPS